MGSAVEPAPAMAIAHLPGRIRIADAAKVFLSHREAAKIAPATLRKYRTFIKQLATFADSRGYLSLDQFASSDIDLFYSGWNFGARAKGKQLGTLRAFFRFCIDRKWLHDNSVSPDIKPPIELVSLFSSRLQHSCSQSKKKLPAGVSVRNRAIFSF